MVNVIAAHVEYLLRLHDCVVVPGFGAFLCNYEAAHFDERRRDVIVPPARHLAFNRMIADSDGVLVWSVARKEGLSFEAASARVGEAVDSLWHELNVYGECAFGRLGAFYRSKNGEISFVSASLPSVNGFLYGLKPLVLDSICADEEPEMVADAGGDADESRIVLPVGMRWRAYATGVVASLAVILTVVLLAVSPIRIDKEMHQAAMAPVPSADCADGDMSASVAYACLSAEDMIVVGQSAEAGAVMPEACCEVEVSVAGVNPSVEVEAAEATGIAAVSEVAAIENAGVEKPADSILRFNSDDAYCVVVASFPSKRQADIFVAEHGVNRHLEILEKDSKFRIYAATGNTYAAADGQRRLVGQEDAWICRR